MAGGTIEARTAADARVILCTVDVPEPLGARTEVPGLGDAALTVLTRLTGARVASRRRTRPTGTRTVVAGRRSVVRNARRTRRARSRLTGCNRAVHSFYLPRTFRISYHIILITRKCYLRIKTSEADINTNHAILSDYNLQIINLQMVYTRQFQDLARSIRRSRPQLTRSRSNQYYYIPLRAVIHRTTQGSESDLSSEQ